MSIKAFQSNLSPIGHFDILDTDLSEILGGEVLVFDRIAEGIVDRTSPDIFVGDGYRSLLRIASTLDSGPFFLAASEKSTAFNSPGIENTSLFSRNQSYNQNSDASGKASFYADEGFYSISSNVVDNATVNQYTDIYSRLYADASGRLTTTPAVSGAIVGYFIEYQSGEQMRGYPQKLQYPSAHIENDSVIVYKTVGDGYFNIGLVSHLIGELGTIGTPTDGYFSDGYFSFTSDTSVADAVDQLNEGLGSLSSGTLSVAIGLPDDGTYLDGFFPFVSTTSVSNAVDDINELLFAIAPAQPDSLTGQTLVLGSTTMYSAILPSGLNAAWYSNGESPGDTIAGYLIDGTYTLTNPSQATGFKGGRVADSSTLGTLTHIEDGVDGYTYDVANDGVGSSGTLIVSDISTYNTIWNKINAQIAYTHVDEGAKTHALKHTLAGTSNTALLFFDDVNTAPSFNAGVSIAENTAVDGYLSGIIFYGPGSTFDISYTAASGIFQKAYHATQVSRIELTGSPNVIVNPSAVPAFGDTFAVSNELVTLSSGNLISESPSVTVRLFKPAGGTAVSTAALSRGINTFGTDSTSTLELFVDEDKRLTSIGSLVPDFSSSSVLVDGLAQVYLSGSGGQVGFPRVADYPALSSPAFYQRFFTKASASSATLVFSGITVADIDPYGTGSTNIIIRLDDDDLYYDAGLPFGSGNGTQSGDSFANSIGCQVGTSSGSTLNITFGVNSTADNNSKYRFIAIFNDTANTIAQITTS